MIDTENKVIKLSRSSGSCVCKHLQVVLPPVAVQWRVAEGGLCDAVAEEGLVVVLGQLGQLGEHLLHAQVRHLALPPSSSAGPLQE